MPSQGTNPGSNPGTATRLVRTWALFRIFQCSLGTGDPALDADVVLVDSPPLVTPEAVPVLRRTGGIVLTCHAEPLSLRTIPAAVGALAAARIHNPAAELMFP